MLSDLFEICVSYTITSIPVTIFGYYSESKEQEKNIHNWNKQNSNRDQSFEISRSFFMLNYNKKERSWVVYLNFLLCVYNESFKLQMETAIIFWLPIKRNKTYII